VDLEIPAMPADVWQIWPAALIWPSQFSSTALLYALHDKNKTSVNANGWTVSRTTFFCYVMIGMFVYYWFPGVIWQGLSVFAFITWYVIQEQTSLVLHI
jgi:hypothetical protein